jgi:hypothetical protein
MTCIHAWSVRPYINPGNRVTGAEAACRPGFSGPSHLARLHFTKGYPNG